MEGIALKTIDVSSPEYQQVWQLREEVLRKPLGMSLKDEDLSNDALDKIVIAMHQETVVACFMLHPIGTLLKLRQMAVYDAYQGKGIGAMLIQEAERIAINDGYKSITLHARIVARGFYAKSGYTAAGPIFTEVGIPHIAMEKTLVK